MRERLAAIFKSRTREQWCAVLEGSDACFSPVLDLDECVRHPHNVARGTHVEFAGVLQPAPAPRFSKTPSQIYKTPPAPGEDTQDALRDWGFSPHEIAGLRDSGVIR
jgi:alpha-methylacyl-CoA racemase